MPDHFLEGLSIEKKAESWRPNLLKHQALGRKRALVAEVDDRVVGYARVGPIEEGRKEVGLLYLLYVLPKYWNQGIGKMLLRQAIDEMMDLGQSEAILWVLRDNSRARDFYESQAWLPDGRTNSEDYGGVKLESVCYERVLV